MKLFWIVFLFGQAVTAGQLDLYIDQSSSVNRARMRQNVERAIKEFAGVAGVKIRLIPFFDDAWNAAVAGEVLIPPAPPSQAGCGKANFSDLSKISKAQRLKEEAQFQQACARSVDEQLGVYQKALAEAKRRLKEMVDTILDQEPPGRCTDLRGLFRRLAWLNRQSLFSSKQTAIAVVFSDMIPDCAPLVKYPEGVVRGRIFVAPVPPVKMQSTAGEYFLQVEEQIGRVAPWARVVPVSFDLSEVLDALR